MHKIIANPYFNLILAIIGVILNICAIIFVAGALVVAHVIMAIISAAVVAYWVSVLRGKPLL